MRKLFHATILGCAGIALAIFFAACATGGKGKAAPTGGISPDAWKIAKGPYQPSWESLIEQYECPDWFRDAKFGIWAHWSAQCVPEQGDWYAKRMYEEANADYKYQVEHYGHPSVFGFKDICNLWKAEKWDPEKLIQLYKNAGAKYFVALANHHCNFDCWNSTYQPWNSVNIGPKKDIVGLWAEAARKAGLRFGVTVHSGRSWSWYEVAHGADKQGPKAGVPYDGVLTKADGAGKWWEGYDPQDLYVRAHKPGEKPDQTYCDKFFNRVKDLIDKYHPDLLYFDDGKLPLNFTDAGLYIAAHLYNSSMKLHKGKNEAVMNTKGLTPDMRKALVWDIERGRSDRVEPYPWQTDTCIGSWHYAISIFENHKYKTATTVITTLIDIVSKNGNLLLNIPVKGDGTIDADEVAVLQDMAKWMDVNSECIFGTRPWVIFGEGAADIKGGGNFNERNARAYTAEDVRFTMAKDGAIYAILMGWPTKDVVIKSFGKSSPLVTGEIGDVKLLGYKGKLEYARDADGLKIKMPSDKPCEHAFAIKITGLKTNASADLSNVPWAPKPASEEAKAPAKAAGAAPAKTAKTTAAAAAKPAKTTAAAPARTANVVTSPNAGKLVEPSADGSLKLDAEFAALHGSKIMTEKKTGWLNIGFWNNAEDFVTWKAKVTQAGTYEVSAIVAAKAVSPFAIEIAGQTLNVKAPNTTDWTKYETIKVGKVEIKQPGEIEIKVRSQSAAGWKAINLAEVSLKLAK
ncbi:MAG: alpha-L-fucosidase [Candidatus Sumerlaeota bacterium]|nr:alpha-L-fucosidase [Candidatus Sumerlaeota bacterium]